MTKLPACGATDRQCNECQGTGLGRIVPRCCRRSDWECGARGCTGPEPEQEPCEMCGGAGAIPLEEVA